MKHLLSLFLLLLVPTSWSQGLVIVDRDKKTERLFDQNNPRSLISLLKLNAGMLGAYDLVGADLSFYSQLDTTSKG